MKKLILVRHAKSSWELKVTDHERPLNDRGYADAETVSKHFKKVQLTIDAVLSSDAVRAKTTANIFIENLNIDKNKVQLVYELYDFSGENLIQTIKDCNNDVDTLMIFGHNHAITAFVNTFGDKAIDNVPTSGVVIIEFAVNSWRDIKPGKTTMSLFPRDLR